MKKLSWFMLGAFILSLGTAAPALAEHGADGKQCKMCDKKDHDCGGKDCDMCDKSGKSECPINGKILKKAKFFLKNQKEIGLSDEQAAQIKAIKVETKKTAIRQAAEMEIFMMDIEAKLSEQKVDVEGLNAMLDQASAGMAAGGKASVANYAKLKAILNEQQLAKAKEIWAAKDKN